jgi:serine/threonine protein kinase
MRDSGIPTAAPAGIVELTPEREYLLVTEFFDGAREIGDAEVDDQVIDEALAIIRQLWDSGLAHRDIKPANLLVKDGHVFLIDVAFAQVRPSPWRQAVDTQHDARPRRAHGAERVYQRALRASRRRIAGAFATRGIASRHLRGGHEQDGATWWGLPRWPPLAARLLAAGASGGSSTSDWRRAPAGGRGILIVSSRARTTWSPCHVRHQRHCAHGPIGSRRGFGPVHRTGRLELGGADPR